MRVSIIIVSAFSICLALAFVLNGLGRRMDLLPFLAVCAGAGCAGVLGGWFVDQFWLQPANEDLALADTREFNWTAYRKPILYPALLVGLLIALGVWLS